MINFDKLLKIDPYSLKKTEKNKLFEESLDFLIKHHYNNCEEYKKIIDRLEYNVNSKKLLTEIPFLPVRLFKMFELLSVKKSEVIKTMTSSGTSGQGLSKIYLDKQTAMNQTKVLSKIVTDIIGNERLPMLIIDTERVIKDRKMFSARGAAILGFSIFSKSRTFALNDDMELDVEKVERFCHEHKNENILIFGFTSLIWKNLYKEFIKKNKKLDFSKAILLHGGGWKKLADESVDNKKFKESLKKATGLKKVYNYYGMIEQTGSIFMECESNNLHCSNFSDIIIRKPDFSVAKKNEIGMIELVSLLPYSYPGHAILSEDLGEVLGEDDCSCGRLGKYFKIHGRIKKAELRGCSDTYE